MKGEATVEALVLMALMLRPSASGAITVAELDALDDVPSAASWSWWVFAIILVLAAGATLWFAVLRPHGIGTVKRLAAAGLARLAFLIVFVGGSAAWALLLEIGEVWVRARWRITEPPWVFGLIFAAGCILWFAALRLLARWYRRALAP